MITIESGVTAVFPMIQKVGNFEYMPESGALTVRNRSGVIVHSQQLDVMNDTIELPAVETEVETFRWVTIAFVVGGRVMNSKYNYRIAPFLATTVNEDDVRVKLSVDDLTLPNAFIDLYDQYSVLEKQYPDVEKEAAFDRLVVLAEAIRLAGTANIWLLQTKQSDDLKQTRFKFDTDKLQNSLIKEFEDTLTELDPNTSLAIPPTLLQFVPVTDAFAGA